MDTSHIFSQGVQTTSPLIVGVVGVVVPRACAGFELGLPLCFMAVASKIITSFYSPYLVFEIITDIIYKIFKMQHL